MVIFSILIIIFNLTAVLIPKKKAKIELFAMGVFACLFASLADVFLIWKYYFYWYFVPQVNWCWLITLFGAKPSVTIIFHNFFPIKSTLKKKIVYMFIWLIVLTGLEWIMVYVAGILQYRAWTIWHSAGSYVVILVILWLYISYVRHLLSHNKWLKWQSKIICLKAEGLPLRQPFR